MHGYDIIPLQVLFMKCSLFNNRHIQIALDELNHVPMMENILYGSKIIYLYNIIFDKHARSHDSMSNTDSFSISPHTEKPDGRTKMVIRIQATQNSI